MVKHASSEAAAPPSEVAAAAAVTQSPAGGKQQGLHATWEAPPDAGASTCVSGSEGSVPTGSQQQQPQKQQEEQSMQHSAHNTEIQPESSRSPDSEAPIQNRQKQQPEHVQQQSGLSLHVAALPPCPTAALRGASSDSSSCSLPPAPTASEGTSCVAAAQGRRGISSSSSCCSSSSIGGELRGLINALAAAEDTSAGGGELQQLLQQLLAERDLYKAAFGAAKEELKELECRQQHLTQALKHSEHQRRHDSMQQQLEAAAVAGASAASPPCPSSEAEGAERRWNPDSDSSNSNGSSMPRQQQQQEAFRDASGAPPNSSGSRADGQYAWLHQLQACVASGTYPLPDLLQKSVEQQQQLIRLAEGLQQERESYVEAVACLHSQLREAREDVSLYLSAHATHAADLTAESDEAFRAADLWLQYALRLGTSSKYWGLGALLHVQEAAAAAATTAGRLETPAVARPCRSAQAEAEAAAAAGAAAAAALANAFDPPSGVSVALAAAASVFGMQDDALADEEDPAAAAGGASAAAAAELERLWWGQPSDVFVERQQLLRQHKQRERNSRVLWFLE
ncbi:uncharacterized protein LOC34619344 [Cyclospora cayetanensis]|uniref:Uncharacterized protein LOC34619344 n=1 Tax=Cyclospora cayetanensis TaxID=88456 RepID=A0A6P6RVK9_9EIME|nr:uncharacterized protein LOC34619344 [Cyclospora cayetanensis]